MLCIVALANPIGVKFVAHVPEFDDFNLVRASPEVWQTLCQQNKVFEYTIPLFTRFCKTKPSLFIKNSEFPAKTVKTARRRVFYAVFSMRLRLALRQIGKSQNIIRGNLIKTRKLDQNIRRNIALPQFIVAVYLLRALQYGGKLLLRQFSILPQVTNPSVHLFTIPFNAFAESDAKRST